MGLVTHRPKSIMPTYAYHCKKCHQSHEEIQKITDAPLQTCPHCGENALQRGPGGGIALQFKGSGFYITDYAKKSSSDSTKE